jgi:hypothetical protein
MKNNLKKILENNFNNAQNNLDMFLLEISKPIINYLENPLFSFEKEFKLALNYQGAHVSQEVNNLVDHFLNSLITITEYADQDLEDFKNDVNKSLKEFINSILKYIENLATENEDFEKDYKLTLKKLLHNKISLEEALESLILWKDNISDKILINHMTQLIYKFIFNSIN